MISSGEPNPSERPADSAMRTEIMEYGPLSYPDEIPPIEREQNLEYFKIPIALVASTHGLPVPNADGIVTFPENLDTTFSID